jgi:hypothetical protein
MNLQSLNEFKFYQLISQKSAFKIMKALTQYEGEENIAKVWAYLSKK